MPSILLSDNGVSSGSAGLKTTAASDGALALQTTTAAGTATTAVTIDTSQRVGIGQSTPAYLLDVNGTMRLGSSGSIQPLLLRSSVTGGLLVNNTASGGAGPLVVQDNGTEVLRVTDSLVVLKGGSTSATGTGITFPATQSASSDANTLDDYEEGTWTPQIKGGSSNPTVTYSTQSGYYTKVGNIVYASAYIAWSAISGGSGEFVVNMPFVGASDNSRGVGSVPYNTGVNFNQYGLCVHSNIASGNCYFIKVDTQQKYSSYVAVSDVNASGVFQLAVVYKV